MSTPPIHRDLAVDTLKAVAAQLILWHHLSAYGPLAAAASAAWPATMEWLYGYARMAVQVFLVVGGYLACRQLSLRPPDTGRGWLHLVWQRYLRLSVPLLVALAVTALAALWARAWLNHDFVPDAPTWWQAVTHALLIHDLMDQEALSTGVWYVAIDFQLYVGLALCLGIAQRTGQLGWAALPVGVLTAASLFVFNRHPDWDSWGLYFWGAYGLGLGAWVAQQRGQPPRRHLVWWGCLVIASASAMALWVDFRERIALATVVALVLASGWQPVWPDRLKPVVAWLSRTSYGLFLLHFAWLLVGNTVFERWLPNTPGAAWATMVGVWLCSMASAHVFDQWVETPLSRHLGRSKAQARTLRPARPPRR
ncbi:MAG: hypothetical protein RJA09_1249 [Pseudomonadota bacterium]